MSATDWYRTIIAIGALAGAAYSVWRISRMAWKGVARIQDDLARLHGTTTATVTHLDAQDDDLEDARRALQQLRAAVAAAAVLAIAWLLYRRQPR